MSFSSEELFGDRTRRGSAADTLSARGYILSMMIFITGGLSLAALIAGQTMEMKPNWLWIVGYFVLAIPGIIITFKSDSWPVSALGYLLVIIPTGAIIGPYVNLFTMVSVVKVVFITIGVSAAIGIAGALYPKSVEHWGGFLLTALFVVIIGDVARAFMPAFGIAPTALALWDWVAVLVFSLYIFYDMNRAMRMTYTLDNAVDNAVALYLDIINLFIRILAIMGDRKSSDD